MTKRERHEVELAIRELMDDNEQFEGAVARLCRLVGWRYPAGEVVVSPGAWDERILRTPGKPDFDRRSVSDEAPPWDKGGVK